MHPGVICSVMCLSAAQTHTHAWIHRVWSCVCIAVNRCNTQCKKVHFILTYRHKVLLRFNKWLDDMWSYDLNNTLLSVFCVCCSHALLYMCLSDNEYTVTMPTLTLPSLHMSSTVRRVCVCVCVCLCVCACEAVCIIHCSGSTLHVWVLNYQQN